MSEIIKRKIKCEKENLSEYETQVSLNNWGHLCFRFFKPDEDKDIIIVFPKETTRKIINFIKKLPDWV